MSHRRTVAAVAAAAAALSLAGSGAAAAPASTLENVQATEVVAVVADDAHTVFATDAGTITVLESTEPTPSDESLAALAPTFTCDLNVQDPHGSRHVAGTINVVAVVKCSAPAGKIVLGTSLSRRSPNYKQWFADAVTVIGKATAQNNRAVNCSEGPGEFRGWAQATLTAPPGTTLVGSAQYSKYGNTKPVACGVADRGAPGYASITVTFVRSDLKELAETEGVAAVTAGS